jgi:hypothetical protein
MLRSKHHLLRKALQKKRQRRRREVAAHAGAPDATKGKAPSSSSLPPPPPPPPPPLVSFDVLDDTTTVGDAIVDARSVDATETMSVADLSRVLRQQQRALASLAATNDSLLAVIESFNLRNHALSDTDV